MRTQRPLATMRLLCASVLMFAVAAGPCRACFDPPAEPPAHNCCPSSEDDPRQQPNPDCSDVRVAVERIKPGPDAPNAIVLPAAETDHALAPAAAFDRFEPHIGAPHSPPPITTLRC